jgi:hypothetical protein
VVAMRLFFHKNLSVMVIFIIAVGSLSWISFRNESAKESTSVVGEKNIRTITKTNTPAIIYEHLQLDDLGLSYKAFEYAMEGYEKLANEGKIENTSVITIVDFDQPSYKKRLYVIDVINQKILFNTWTAHGKNTGRETAQYFSNAPKSNKSSLGFYITDETYYGRCGYSLKLTGLEQNLNNHAFDRGIVLHGADYVSESFINAQGYIGRSNGCPAVPQELNMPIIETIKNGSLFFIYNKSYTPSKQFSN